VHCARSSRRPSMRRSMSQRYWNLNFDCVALNCLSCTICYT
jgi:hypothetical protein